MRTFDSTRNNVASSSLLLLANASRNGHLSTLKVPRRLRQNSCCWRRCALSTNVFVGRSNSAHRSNNPVSQQNQGWKEMQQRNDYARIAAHQLEFRTLLYLSNCRACFVRAFSFSFPPALSATGRIRTNLQTILSAFALSLLFGRVALGLCSFSWETRERERQRVCVQERGREGSVILDTVIFL